LSGGYTILRKLPGDADWSGQVDLASGITTWTDNTVAVGTSYEYAIRHSYSHANYIATGINLPVVDARGAVVLLVDAAQSAGLATELTRLVDDLRGDGWQVLRHDVATGSLSPAVKAMILADNAAAPGQVKEVLIVGHVAVPYSGQLNPDGHPDHQGAWPADTYYADLAGTWTDTYVDTTSASRVENCNTIGDGKFDQSYIPSSTALVSVGRVDLSNMPAFAPTTETALLRRYLDRDHAWRTGQVAVQRKALVDDNFGEFGSEAFAQSGWRLSSLVGVGNVAAQDWFTILGTDSYLFAYGCGGGWYQGASGVGSTGNFANGPSNAVFTMLFGSYFGDWDAQDGFLRAPLAGTGLGLTCCWAGRPGVSLHRMGMGATIGESMVANLMGNTYTPSNYGAGLVHQALMGDPTLRLHPMVPPGSVTASAGGGSATLTWTSSPDAALGYHVYRASGGGAFARVTSSPVSGTSYIDGGLALGSYTYQVRAIRLEVSPTGTYLNNSQGSLANVEILVLSPTVTSLSVTSGSTAGGTATTITGSNFTGATAVTFGGIAATSVVVVNATTITCVTPAHAVGAVAVEVTTSGGNGTLASGFTYGAVPAVPTVTSVSVTSGSTAGGTATSITGSNFTGATTVTFGGIAATSVVVVNATTITCVTPAHTAGAVAIVVTTPGGNGTLASGFTYVAPSSSTSGGSVTSGDTSSDGSGGCGMGGGLALVGLLLTFRRRR